MATVLLRSLRTVPPAQSARSRDVCVSVKAAFRLISRPNVTPIGQPRRSQQLSTVAPNVLASPSKSGLAETVNGTVTFHGVHHVALLCANLERSLEFYQGLLELELNPDRPHHKLPYRGAWLWIGPEMIHLMELPNPDSTDKDKRPEHGGRDRHFCIGVANLDALAEKLEKAGVTYTHSMSGRPAIFFRDPDMNCLECVELESWR
eukprot:GHRR01000716.1.p1 GENE.GHRR01000716.1~~GHRR01000716.1.p1  ORF type:complete len:205 (+),score=33.91 GHRR01000716.1:77-691(+)